MSSGRFLTFPEPLKKSEFVELYLPFYPETCWVLQAQERTFARWFLKKSSVLLCMIVKGHYNNVNELEATSNRLKPNPYPGWAPTTLPAEKIIKLVEFRGTLIPSFGARYCFCTVCWSYLTADCGLGHQSCLLAVEAPPFFFRIN